MPGAVICCGGGAPGLGNVSGEFGVCCGSCPGCIIGGIVPAFGGIPGNWLLTGPPGCGIGTLIGSSLSSMGCGGRWKFGGGAELTAAVADGARLVGMIVTRS
jgi:hypothetical protein